MCVLQSMQSGANLHIFACICAGMCVMYDCMCVHLYLFIMVIKWTSFFSF